MSSIPLSIPHLKNILDDYPLSEGEFNLLLEVSIKKIRYQVISSTHIWGNRIQEPKELKRWEQRLGQLLRPASAPPDLALDIFYTFGRLVSNEKILLETADLLPDFAELIGNLLLLCRERYGELGVCLPFGNLFRLEIFQQELTQLLPGVRMLTPLVDNSLPVYNDKTQAEWNKAADFEPQLQENYSFRCVMLDEENREYKFVRERLCGPDTDYPTPVARIERPLYIELSTHSFVLRIEAKDPITRQSEIVYCAEYSRTEKEVILHFSFRPGSDIPVIELVGATLKNELPNEQPPAFDKSAYQFPDEMVRHPQIVFLLDGGLNLATFKKTMRIIQDLAGAQLQDIDSNARMHLVIFGDQEWAGDSSPGFTLRTLPEWSGMADIKTFIAALQQADPWETLQMSRNRSTRGCLELALRHLNTNIAWDEGERLMICIGLARPYMPNEYLPNNTPINWQDELAQIRQKEIQMCSLYINLFGEDAFRDDVKIAREVWRQLGSHGFYFEDDLTDPKQIDKIAQLIRQFLKRFAHPRRRYLFHQPIDFPLAEPYWNFLPERGTDRLAE